jgi:hypothetical protein
VVQRRWVVAKGMLPLVSTNGDGSPSCPKSSVCGQAVGVENQRTWKAQSVEDRIDRLEKAARAAMTLYDNNQEQEYQAEAFSIYNRLRASWERAIEDIAFFHIIHRHRDYMDTKNLKKVTALTESACDAFQIGYKKCCDTIDAHDPSTGRNAAAPPPNEILQDIQTLKDWSTALRGLQKKIA